MKAYGLPPKTFNTIMMFYKDMKAMVCLPDGDTDFFDIVARIVQGYTLVSYIFIICPDYVLCISIDLIKKSVSHWERQEADDIQRKQIEENRHIFYS